MLDIKDLEAFIAILDTNSISKAALELHLTQPALSLKLKKLEQDLGCHLFQRSARNLVPLEAALTIAPQARALIMNMQGIKESLTQNIKQISGLVKIGCITGWFDSLLIACIPLIQKQAPLLQLRLHVDSVELLLQMVLQGKLDFAIIAKPFEICDGLEVEHLLDEQLILIGHQQLTELQNDKNALRRTLLKCPWIGVNHQDSLIQIWWRKQFNQDFPFSEIHMPVTVDHITAIPRLLQSLRSTFPNAVAIVPKQIFRLDSSLKSLIDASHHHNGVYLVWRSHLLEWQRFRVVKKMLLEQAKNL